MELLRDFTNMYNLKGKFNEWFSKWEFYRQPPAVCNDPKTGDNMTGFRGYIYKKYCHFFYQIISRKKNLVTVSQFPDLYSFATWTLTQTRTGIWTGTRTPAPTQAETRTGIRTGTELFGTEDAGFYLRSS
jgi:hypothetical protein